MQQVRGRAVSTRLPRAKSAPPAQARPVSHVYATYELRVEKYNDMDATRRRMAHKAKSCWRAPLLLRGAVGTIGAQELVTRSTGRPEAGTTGDGARSALV